MRISGLMAAVSVLALFAPAVAAPYKFVVVDSSLTQSGVPLDGNSYTFFFDSAPTPVTSTALSFSLDGSVFYSAGVFGNYRVDGPFDFLVGDGNGFSTPLGLYFSDQLFTGTTAAPIFKLGKFDTDLGSITISAVGGTVGAVPEPAAWTTMIAGFGLVGVALRSRRTRVRFAI